MGWFFVFCAAISEIVGVIGLKMYSKDKTLANGAIYIGVCYILRILVYIFLIFTSQCRVCGLDRYWNSRCRFIKHVLVWGVEK